ncbi:hypothetical protein BT96DRAFT_948255 [Gymnopus androsaceus JB14]|uniref:Uncharacterized protein n=1 Tax=Gymnopus androsaceus JB14 TaxID=1447944 RepID=A0A6A4GPA4_9AGAR|nr:hypothetical protein BT96DRAFT_948255 [Gymnopus androsaceus JB14]
MAFMSKLEVYRSSGGAGSHFALIGWLRRCRLRVALLPKWDWAHHVPFGKRRESHAAYLPCFINTLLTLVRGLGNHKEKRGRILSARSALQGQHDNVSGLSIEVKFEYGYIHNQTIVAWIDFDHLRRADNMRFIHNGHSRNTGDRSFFQFKVGYTPTYSTSELIAFNWPKPLIVPQLTPGEGSDQPALSPYLRPDKNAHPIPVPGDFWLLDCRLWEALGQRELYVASASNNLDECISLECLGNGRVVLRAHKQRRGGSKKSTDFNPVDLTTLSKTPLAHQIKDIETANGLYLICQGEHTGKLARRIRVIKSPGERATWWLQIVSCTWMGRSLAHSEAIVADEIVRTKPDIFVVVHEIDATKKNANEMMCAIREQTQVLQMAIEWKMG